MTTDELLDGMRESLRPLREKLVGHEIYHQIETLADLRIFMEHHVFAVWDFMSLLKALQRDLTCVAIPWVPQGNRLSRRLINEIVLEEESDADSVHGYISHFELYRAAMEHCHTDLSRIDAFLNRIRGDQAVATALSMSDAPPAAQAFVRKTMAIIETGSTHSIAAAFTLGREDVIPKMFAPLVTKLEHGFPGQLTIFRDYLERHIRLDDERHTPMALRMLVELCGDDLGKWKEAEDTARAALIARIALWDGVAEQIASARSKGRFMNDGSPRSHRLPNSQDSAPYWD
jgi:hypothetical protein